LSSQNWYDRVASIALLRNAIDASDLQEWLFHSHMGSGSGSGVTNSLGVGSGVGSGVGANYLLRVTLGVDLSFESDFGSGLCIVYILLVLQKAVNLSFFEVSCGSHGL
jgi:hypothetical protein